MNNDYKTSEVVEIGNAQDIILDGKPPSGIDDLFTAVEGSYDDFEE